MEADGLPAESPEDESGQEVLARVLLHVVESPLPVECQDSSAQRDPAGREMGDAPVILDILDRHVPDPTSVCWLPSAFRIEKSIPKSDFKSSFHSDTGKNLGIKGP